MLVERFLGSVTSAQLDQAKCRELDPPAKPGWHPFRGWAQQLGAAARHPVIPGAGVVVSWVVGVDRPLPRPDQALDKLDRRVQHVSRPPPMRHSLDPEGLT